MRAPGVREASKVSATGERAKNGGGRAGPCGRDGRPKGRDREAGSMLKHDSPVAGGAGEPPKSMRKYKRNLLSDCRVFKRAARVGWVGKAPAPSRASRGDKPRVWIEPYGRISVCEIVLGDG